MSLKETRNEKGWTQDKVAKWLDMNLRTYQNIEKRNDTTVKIALEISKLFKKPIEEIFTKEKLKKIKGY